MRCFFYLKKTSVAQIVYKQYWAKKFANVK